MSCCCCNSCENNVDDYDIDQLVDEINYRAQKGKGTPLRLICADDVPDIFKAIRRGDLAYAESLLEMALRPKWRDVEVCKKAYKEAQVRLDV